MVIKDGPREEGVEMEIGQIGIGENLMNWGWVRYKTLRSIWTKDNE